MLRLCWRRQPSWQGISTARGAYAGQLEYWVFGLALSALIPLAQAINDVTEGLSPYLGKVSRGLIEATFSNVPEIAIGVFLLIKAHESATLLDTNFVIIRGLLIGSVINNVLLVLGSSVLLRRDAQWADEVQR